MILQMQVLFVAITLNAPVPQGGPVPVAVLGDTQPGRPDGQRFLREEGKHIKSDEVLKAALRQRAACPPKQAAGTRP